MSFLKGEDSYSYMLGYF
uniref:Uncharacterized protein n=1 Tax=Anguilla anguilla TaxID=7936 RepID=A0A0E9Q159_ANGAN